MKRLTVVIPQDFAAELEAIKKECYCNDNQSDKIKDLIYRGLAVKKAKEESLQNDHIQRINELLEKCEDIYLLDLIYKLLRKSLG